MDMDVTSWLVPLIFWAFVGAVILVPLYLKSRDRQRLYETLRIAYEHGQPVHPELVAAIRSRAADEAALPPAERDLRTGVILLAAGLGMCGLGYGLWFGLMSIDELSAWTTGGWIGGAGAIISLVGTVFLGFWVARRGKAPGRGPGIGAALADRSA
ncbi:MAG TPA: hypothetical protein VII63_11410 [Caulobacteraceae bacterium]